MRRIAHALGITVDDTAWASPVWAAEFETMRCPRRCSCRDGHVGAPSARPGSRRHRGTRGRAYYLTVMWPIGLPPHWVGREQELAILRAGIEALGRGEGTVVWVEGEPGIGKSCLVAKALAAADQLGLDVGWGMADKLTERLPLAVMQDCLQVRLSSPDPRRAHAADLLRELPRGL